jgi:hypothetical protein
MQRGRLVGGGRQPVRRYAQRQLVHRRGHHYRPPVVGSQQLDLATARKLRTDRRRELQHLRRHAPGYGQAQPCLGVGRELFQQRAHQQVGRHRVVDVGRADDHGAPLDVQRQCADPVRRLQRVYRSQPQPGLDGLHDPTGVQRERGQPGRLGEQAGRRVGPVDHARRGHVRVVLHLAGERAPAGQAAVVDRDHGTLAGRGAQRQSGAYPDGLAEDRGRDLPDRTLDDGTLPVWSEDDPVDRPRGQRVGRSTQVVGVQRLLARVGQDQRGIGRVDRYREDQIAATARAGAVQPDAGRHLVQDQTAGQLTDRVEVGLPPGRREPPAHQGRYGTCAEAPPAATPLRTTGRRREQGPARYPEQRPGRGDHLDAQPRREQVRRSRPVVVRARAVPRHQPDGRAAWRQPQREYVGELVDHRRKQPDGVRVDHDTQFIGGTPGRHHGSRP